MILAPVALFPFLLVGALFFFRSTGIKRAVADPAVYAAQTSPAVAAAIGLPIEPGWPIHGSVNANKMTGDADLEIPVSGSHGKGRLLEWAQKERGKWYICSLLFRADGGGSISLVDPATTHCEAE